MSSEPTAPNRNRPGVMDDWTDLAADIRAVDGNHDTGAGELAARLIDLGWTRLTSPDPSDAAVTEPPDRTTVGRLAVALDDIDIDGTLGEGFGPYLTLAARLGAALGPVIPLDESLAIVHANVYDLADRKGTMAMLQTLSSLPSTPVRPDRLRDATVTLCNIAGRHIAGDSDILPEDVHSAIEDARDAAREATPVRPDLTAALIHEATDNAGLACDGDHGKGWGSCQLIATRLDEGRAEQVERPDLLAEFALLTEARNRMNDLLAYKQAHPVSGGVGTRIIAVADALAALVMATLPPLSDQASERRTG